MNTIKLKKNALFNPEGDTDLRHSWNDIGDYEIGQTVPYKYESNIPNMNGYKIGRAHV